MSGPQTSDLKMITSQNTNEPYGLSLGQALFSIIWLQAVLHLPFLNGLTYISGQIEI